MTSQITSRSVTWGTEPEERSMAFPCDRNIEHFDAVYYRGITIKARPHIIFRWLRQMRVAPYSYDWIDNLGRQSPRTLTPGLERLAVGQEIMGGFELVEFESNRHLTFRTKKTGAESRIFGDIGASYLIVPQNSHSCRLIVKLIIRYPGGVIGWFMRRVLPWGDMIMMRRQLLNFKRLSEEMTSDAHKIIKTSPSSEPRP